MTERAPEITLRFMASPNDIAILGETMIGGGRVLEWIDKAAYACAVGWSGGYCVTAYVGNVAFTRPIHSGEVVEVRARLVYTGRSSMHIEVGVSSSSPRTVQYSFATSCTVVFVAVGEDGEPIPVIPWAPKTRRDEELATAAVANSKVRDAIGIAMAGQSYTSDSNAPSASLRFLAAPTDVNWGGKTHGGTVMRWIDEAAYVCAAGWSKSKCVTAYSGRIRFYRPIPIGHLVQLDARLVHTGRTSMHVSVHVKTADPSAPQLLLSTHCLTILVAVGDLGRPVPVRRWEPQLPEDRWLDEHAQQLMVLRSTASSL
jgi:4-hydroxybenzoyl-CoA thioesterase